MIDIQNFIQQHVIVATILGVIVSMLYSFSFVRFVIRLKLKAQATMNIFTFKEKIEILVRLLLFLPGIPALGLFVVGGNEILGPIYAIASIMPASFYFLWLARKTGIKLT